MSVSSPRASRAAASPRPPRDGGVLSFLDLAGSEGRHQISLGTTSPSTSVGRVKDLVDAAHGIPASLVAILRVPSDSEEEVLADGDEIDIDEAMSNGKQAFLIRRQSSGSCSTEASSTQSPGSEGNLSGRATPVLAGHGFPVGDERDEGHKEHAVGEFGIVTSRPQNDNSKQADKIFSGRGGYNGVCAYSPPAFVARNSSDESSQHHDHEGEGGSCAPPRRGRLRLIVRPASASYETNSWEQLNARGLHACREYLYAIGGVSSLPAIVTFFRLASWGLENMCHAWLLSIPRVGASARSWEELGFVDPCSGASAFMLACQKFSFQVPALMLAMMSDRSLHDHLSQVSRWGVTALLCVREERLGLLILDHLMLAAGAAASSWSGEGPTSACSGNIVRCEPTTAPGATTEFFHNSGRAASSSGSRSGEAPTAPFFSPSNRHTAVAAGGRLLCDRGVSVERHTASQPVFFPAETWNPTSSTVVVPNSFPAAARPRARAAGVLSKPALRMLLADDVLHSSNILHLVGARRYRKLAVRVLELVQAEVASIIEERERNRKQAVGGAKSAAERPLRVVPVVARVHGMQLSAKRWDAAATGGIKAEVAIQRFLTLPDRVNRTPTQFFKEAGWLDLCRTIEGLLEVLE
eukprot:g11945.t1